MVESEVELLRRRGHEVTLYHRDNTELASRAMITVATSTFWSKRTTREMNALISNFRPDIIHIHNTFPLISPSIYWVASRHRIPVIQTLHNFRLLCPQAMFLRDGAICEDCLGQIPWRGAMRHCYHDSLPHSAAIAAMLTLHRFAGTWRNKVTRYLALNEFCRQKFVAGGLPARRIAIKPNFVNVPAPGQSTRSGALFAGRLSHEKGIAVLLDALKELPDVRCQVVGSGPERHLIGAHPTVQERGAISADEVISEMRNSAYLVMPSICYENFPRTIVEAYASGLPVIASRLGAIPELVEDGRTGLLFDPGDTVDLARKMMWAEAHPQEMRAMGERARRVYETKYTPEINYNQLMAIYREAIDEVSRDRR